MSGEPITEAELDKIEARANASNRFRHLLVAGWLALLDDVFTLLPEIRRLRATRTAPADDQGSETEE